MFVKLNKPLLFLYIFSFPFQTLGGEGASPAGPQIKIYNIVFLFLILFSIRFKGTITSPGEKKEKPKLILPYLIITYFLIILSSMFWAYDKNSALLFFIKYIFVAVQSVFIFHLIKSNPKAFDTIRSAFEVSGAVFFFILVYQILHLGLFTYFLDAGMDNSSAGKLEYFGNIGLTFGGGKNLLGTWEAIASIFTYTHLTSTKNGMPRSKLFLLRSAFLFSTLAMFMTLSRTAIIGWGMGILAFHFFSQTMWSLFKRVGMVCVLIIILLVITGNALPILNMVVEHFAGIGNTEDPGSLGRLVLWSIAKDILRDNYLLGIGLGNSSYIIANSPNPFYGQEDNFHNVYLQNFVEFGIVGGVLFLFIWLGILFKSIKKVLFDSHFDPWIRTNTVILISVLLAYSVFCLFQFRGPEPEIWLLLILAWSMASMPVWRGCPIKTSPQ